MGRNLPPAGRRPLKQSGPVLPVLRRTRGVLKRAAEQQVRSPTWTIVVTARPLLLHSRCCAVVQNSHMPTRLRACYRLVAMIAHQTVPRQPFVATSIPFGQHSIYIQRDPLRGYQWASPSANKDKEIDRDKNKDTRRQTGPRHKHEQRAGSGEYRGWTSGLNTPRRAGRMGKQGASCLRAALSTRRGRVDRPSPGPAPFWPNASGSPEGAV